MDKYSFSLDLALRSRGSRMFFAGFLSCCWESPLRGSFFLQSGAVLVRGLRGAPVANKQVALLPSQLASSGAGGNFMASIGFYYSEFSQCESSCGAVNSREGNMFQRSEVNLHFPIPLKEARIRALFSCY